MNHKLACFLSASIIISGLAYSIYLLSLVKKDVFYSGDGGVKVLLVKQYSQKGFGLTLDLEAPTWVKEIWDKGLYPFGPPFVYKMEKGHVTSFPVFFAALSAIFYKPFGLYGLYIIPMTSLWALWIMFRRMSQKLELPEEVVAVSLAVLVFGSPLTLYGAMFWEHTLGVLLAFCGASFLLTSQKNSGRGRGLVWGVLTGLSIYFRSEAYVIVAAYAILAVFLYLRHKVADMKFFLGGMALSVAFLWSFNTFVCENPLGVHSLQVIEDNSSLGAFDTMLRKFQTLLADLSIFVPVVILILIYMPMLSFAKHRKTASAAVYAAFISAFFIFGVPFVLPNTGGKQWGPRYLLLLMPLLSLLAGICFWWLIEHPRKIVKYALLSIFIAASGFGIYKNTILGSRHLAADYELKFKPTLDFVRQSDSVCVAVLHEYIAQQLGGVFDTKFIFLVHSDYELAFLTNKLFQRGIPRYLLVSHSHPELEKFFFASDYSLKERVNLSKVGEFGRYDIFQLELEKMK